MKPFTRDEVEIRVTVSQDDIPVGGNAIASGDDTYDRQVEMEIMKRLDAGDIWAWAFVTVTATWNSFSGESSLGACSYDNEEQFRAHDTFKDMVDDALANLTVTCEYAMADLKYREKFLKNIGE